MKLTPLCPRPCILPPTLSQGQEVIPVISAHYSVAEPTTWPCQLEHGGAGVAGKCDASAGSQDWVNTDKFLLFGSPISRFLTFLIMTNIFIALCFVWNLLAYMILARVL